MPPPNTLFIPTTARSHSEAAFTEMRFALDQELGLIDNFDDLMGGGDYLHLPRHGRFSAGFDRVDVTGTLTTAITPSTMTYKDQVAPVLHRSMLMEFYGVEPERAIKLTAEEFSAEIGRQIAVEAILTMILDLYRIAKAAFYTVGTSHRYSPYVDTAVVGNQVTMSAPVMQTAKALMGDNQMMLDLGIMHSKQWSDLTKSSISSTYNVFNIMGDVYKGGQFRELLGTSWLVDDRIPTDAGASATKYSAVILRSRKNANTGNAPFAMGLQRPLVIYDQHVLGAQSIKFQRQPEISYALCPFGKAWDVTGGGANPSTVNLTNATLWLDAYASAVASGHREVGGVLLQTN